MGYIQAKDTHGEIPVRNVARRFTVDLRQEGDRWLLMNYKIDGLPGRVVLTAGDFRRDDWRAGLRCRSVSSGCQCKAP